jgi:hypothetical protein
MGDDINLRSSLFLEVGIFSENSNPIIHLVGFPDNQPTTPRRLPGCPININSGVLERSFLKMTKDAPFNFKALVT